MGSVIPLKKSANSAYLDLKNILGNRLLEVENLIESKLQSEVDGEILFSKLFMMADEYAQGEVEVINDIESIVKIHSKIEK